MVNDRAAHRSATPTGYPRRRRPANGRATEAHASDGMRTHGWGGHPPASDEEAVQRILRATRACLDRGGSDIGIVDIARELNVTRQTVYRYFASTDDLIRATAFDASAEFIDKVTARVSSRGDDPADALVEALTYVLEGLHEEPYFRLLLEPGRASIFAKGITAEHSIAVGRTVLHRLPIDWAAYGFDDALLDELAEFLLRVLQSFIVDPGDPPRSKQQLRAFLSRWVGSAIEGARAGITTA
jgi:AcrR family transcriptional regulator